MPNISDMRTLALQFFQEGVNAADPAKALKAALDKTPLKTAPKGRLIIIAAGKAAIPMMREALRNIPKHQNYDAIAVTNYENGASLDGAEVLVAGHPVPDENGARAAAKIIEKLENAGANDRVVALISGGASALLPAPVNDIELKDKIEINDLLLKSGFEITELNLVRQQLSRLKGGGMTRLAHPAPVTAFILSDVIGDDLRAVASGPTVAPIGTRQEALELLEAANLSDKIPPRVKKYLSKESTPPQTVEANNQIIGSNRKSLEAVQRSAEQEGWPAAIVSDALIGDVETAAAMIASQIKAGNGTKQCLIFGGETSVMVRGKGKGGRNQELALRVSMLCQNLPFKWVFLSGGTDGRDGPTDAAGGMVDGQTIARIEAENVDPNARLAESDSYHALKASGDLIQMPATGTNVADVQIALINA